MRIRCERCATTYELDERKLPPHGGMVKCTRCQHVFRAAPPGSGPVTREGVPSPGPARPPESAAAPEAARAARGNGVDTSATEKTAVFGYAAGGEAEGTASLGSAAPASPVRRDESSGPEPARESRSAGGTAATPGGRRWVWALVGIALAVAAGLLFLLR